MKLIKLIDIENAANHVCRLMHQMFSIQRVCLQLTITVWGNNDLHYQKHVSRCIRRANYSNIILHYFEKQSIK